jgi:hypothetical protein
VSDNLYDTDFHTWTQRMAEAIRQGRWNDLDRENVADEIESLGHWDERQVRHLLSSLITELTLWWAQPELRCGKWASRIFSRRHKLQIILKDSPSLLDGLADSVAELSPLAVEKAVTKARLINNPYPGICSFTAEQILDSGFWPSSENQ